MIHRIAEAVVPDAEVQKQVADAAELNAAAELNHSVDPYVSDEFTQKLIAHMCRAKIAALRDAQERPE